MYNLVSFGNKLKEIRNNLNYTQSDISKLAFLDIKTLSRIENGKVIPKLETLEVLSYLYKEDLTLLLLNYRFGEYENFYKIKKDLHLNNHNDKLNNLKLIVSELKYIYNNSQNNLLKSEIIQTILFVNGLYSLKKKSYQLSYKFLIKSIKQTKNFNLNEFDKFEYNDFELHIIMNIALVLQKLNYYDLYFQLMKFCNSRISSDNILSTRILLNLGNAYRRDYSSNKETYKSAIEKALDCYAQGIEFGKSFNNYNDFDLLYYSKGMMQYKLYDFDYKNSFKNNRNTTHNKT